MSKGLIAVHLLLLVLSSLGLIHCRVRARGSLNNVEENLKFEHMLKIQKKAAVKTIEEEGGGIFDCIDINKQLSLNNPLLKNHIIQRQPSAYPYFHNHQELWRSISHANVSEIACPVGTTPIRRTTKQGLLKHTSFSYFGAHQITKNPLQSNINDGASFAAIRGTTPGSYYGGRSSLSIHTAFAIYPSQLSGAMLWNTNQGDGIAAGWMVSPELYDDYHPRLTAFWNTIDMKGCYNTLCPGFVQVGKTVGLGWLFQNISKYGGEQFYVTISISKDKSTGNWWLLFGDRQEPVGYWPSALFTALSGSASLVETGGTVLSPKGLATPSMGSGHFPIEGFGRAALAFNIQTVNDNGTYVKPTGFFSGYSAPTPNCYNISELQDGNAPRGLHFYYGGHGDCVA